MEAKQLIGLDVGEKRIGVARGSTVAKIAEPLTTIDTAGGLRKLQQIIKDEAAETIVVGLPRNLQGEDTAQTTWVRKWVDSAKQHISTNFYWQDEALTSQLAEAQKLAHKTVHNVDALAAAIILQDFLDAPESERQPC